MTCLYRCKKSYRVLALVAGLVLVAASGRAAETAPPAASLRLIPADAAFYSTMLRAGEQIEIIAKSKAWAKIKSLPSVQMLMQMAEAQLKNPQDPHVAVPANISAAGKPALVAMLNDMVSHEVFCYGAENVSSFIELMTIVNGAQQMGNFLALMPGADRGKVQAHVMLQALNEHRGLIQIPDTVIGFKLRDREAAEHQLKRLDSLLANLMQQFPPPLRERYKKGKGANMFTVTLDGSLIPWDKVSLKQFEDREGEFDDLVAKLKTVKMTISLGLRDDYLLLAVGESTEFLQKLGGEKLLADRPEFKPLQKYTGERLTAISYASKNLRAKEAGAARTSTAWPGTPRSIWKRPRFPRRRARSSSRTWATWPGTSSRSSTSGARHVPSRSSTVAARKALPTIGAPIPAWTEANASHCSIIWAARRFWPWSGGAGINLRITSCLSNGFGI